MLSHRIVPTLLFFQFASRSLTEKHTSKKRNPFKLESSTAETPSVSVRVSKVSPKRRKICRRVGKAGGGVGGNSVIFLPTSSRPYTCTAKVCLQTVNYSSLHRFTTPPPHRQPAGVENEHKERESHTYRRC